MKKFKIIVLAVLLAITVFGTINWVTYNAAADNARQAANDAYQAVAALELAVETFNEDMTYENYRAVLDAFDTTEQALRAAHFDDVLESVNLDECRLMTIRTWLNYQKQQYGAGDFRIGISPKGLMLVPYVNEPSGQLA